MIDFTKEPYRAWLREGLIAAGIDLSQPAGLETAKAVRASLSAREPYSEDVADLRAAVIADVAELVAPMKPEVLATPARGWVGCVYGKGKVGKTTLAMMAPGAFCLDVEDGLGWIEGPSTRVETWEEYLRELKKFSTSAYKTAVIDTADMLEKHLWEHVMEENKLKSMKADWHSGYALAAQEWSRHLQCLRKCAAKQGKNFLFTAHQKITSVTNTEGEAYEQASIALHKDAAEQFFSQMDFCAHAHFAMVTRKNEAKDVLALTTGERMLNVGCETLSAMVGNRFGIIGKVPMNASFFKLLGRRN